jgi:hypothetical protein
MFSTSFVRNALTLLSILISSTTFAYPIDWNSLDQYLGMRSREEIVGDLRILLQQGDDEVQRQFEHHLLLKDDHLEVVSEPGKVEYRFEFQNLKPRITKQRGDQVLSGYTIALDGNNLSVIRPDYFPLTQEISSLLAKKLEEGDAKVLLTQRRENMSSAEYASIVDEIVAAHPDIALAIRFKSGGIQQPNNTFVSFCPGCFMKGELDAEQFRFRFVHALVSGKIWESAKLATHIASKVRGMRCEMQLLDNVNTFGVNACGIPMTPALAETCASLGLFDASEPPATLPGVLGRNLFFNAVPAQVNVWLNPGDELMQKGAEEIAEAYFQGILSYVQQETDRGIALSTPAI